MNEDNKTTPTTFAGIKKTVEQVRAELAEHFDERRKKQEKRISAFLNNEPPYKQEDLEKIPYVGTVGERIIAAAKQARDIALYGQSVTVVKAEERPHHPYSPSTLQPLEACPCYRSKQSDTPHPRTVIGTISHGVTETGEDDARLSDEDVDKVVECIDFYERRKQIMLEAYGREISKPHPIAPILDPVQELKETYLPIDEEVFPDGVLATTAGYIDCALINHTRKYAEIFDWKFGFWPVEQASNNLQGIAYALGMFRRFPSLETVRYFFKQPNLDYVTDATISRADIPAHYLRIQVVVANARVARQAGDFSRARAYVPACNFCARIGECEIVSKFACKIGSKFSPLDIPADITPSIVHSPADTKLGFQLASVVEVWAQAFRQTVTNRVLSRQASPPPGYSLVSREGNRKIVDVEKCRTAALRHLTVEEYEKTLKPSLTAIQKVISLKAPRGQKTDAVKQFAEELEQEGAVTRSDEVAFLKATPTKPKAENSREEVQ